MIASSRTSFGFPFAADEAGGIHATGGAQATRGRIIQVLFTAPGERVNFPEFGCGLFHLVFEPGNQILIAAMEFTIGQALTRWLGAEIVVENVSVELVEGTANVEVLYISQQDLSRQAVRIQFR
jgi:phage baseplate assembly protein W